MAKGRILAAAVGAWLMLGQVAGAQTTGNQVTVPFSDPSRPGSVRVSMISGSISVKVGTGRDVIVGTSNGEREDERERERARRRENDPSTAGLRRLTQPAGVNVEEENNAITVSVPLRSGRSIVTLEVPAQTSLVLRTVNGGEVSVEGVNGSIEVNNVNGSIRLTNVGGAVIAHATNGAVVATLRQVAAGKPMSFTSFNGNVDVTLPASAKANLKLRSDRGDVYTDFDVKTTPPPAGAAVDSRDDRRNSRRDRDDDKDKAKYSIQMDRSIYGTVNGGGPDFELRTFNGNIYLRKAN